MVNVVFNQNCKGTLIRVCGVEVLEVWVKRVVFPTITS